MKITLSNNPIDNLLCSLDNYLMELKSKRWHKGNYKCTCRICGRTITSKSIQYCPEECGWVKIKERRHVWICHSCFDHHDEHWTRKE